MWKLIKNIFSNSDPDLYFRTDHLKADLKRRSVRGGAVTLVAQACKFLLNIGSTIILARLLTPQDYGLIGMVAVVTGFVELFKDMGLSMATVQKAEIDHQQVSTLFWINTAVSSALMVVTAASGPLLAWFYDEPRLTWITIAMGSGLIFSGLTSQHQALLSRQMRFSTLAAIDLASMLLGIVVGIVSAWYDLGYWALVWMQLAGRITNAAGVWLMCGWRPGLPVKQSGVRSMLAFGGNLTGFTVLNYFARNLDNLLIGKYWGAQELGLYAKAYQLLLLPIQQINAPVSAVALPTLSRLVDSPEKYRQTYLRILEKVTMLTMPGAVFTIATSDWLIWLLLGPQWTGASLIFALLGITALVQPVSNTIGWLFTTEGRTWQLLQWGFINGVMAIIAIVGGLPWGAVGVAASYAITGLLIRTPLLFWWVSRGGAVRTSDFYRTMAPSAYASVGALLALLAFRYWVSISDPRIGLAIAFAIAVAVTLLIFAALPKGRLALRDFKDLLAFLIKSRRKEEAK